MSVVTDGKGRAFNYRIYFSLRCSETDWREKRNAIIRKRQNDIDAILETYGAA